MPYKVLFVEDEIAIREGIRDNVDWKAHGFEFCGEAPDGEMALPILHALKPDLLITDIRMPFMDGLQLSQIVRERLPATKIIILSGHDEFEYAQRAIKLGVCEYLLKPVSLQDMHQVLKKVALELDQVRAEQQALQKLHDQVEENRAALRERFLLGLVTGKATPAEAIEKSQSLGIDLISRNYVVVAIRIEAQKAEPLEIEKLQQLQMLASSLVENNPDAFLLRKDVRELILLVKGNSLENLHEERDLLLERMRLEVELAQCELICGFGAPQERITDIPQSFLIAENRLQDATSTLSNRSDETNHFRVDRQYSSMIRHAQEYLDRSYKLPDLSLSDVAAQVGLSAGHFSTVFSQETGQTFKEYLTELRIKKAKELLRTTTLKAFEICYQVGYNDPHYFSHVFHKNTGLTPMEFRLKVQSV